MSQYGKTDMVRGVKHRANKAKPARVDADGTAKPLTVFRGKKPAPGVCYDPNRIEPTELVHRDPLCTCKSGPCVCIAGAL